MIETGPNRNSVRKDIFTYKPWVLRCMECSLVAFTHTQPEATQWLSDHLRDNHKPWDPYPVDPYPVDYRSRMLTKALAQFHVHMKG